MYIKMTSKVVVICDIMDLEIVGLLAQTSTPKKDRSNYFPPSFSYLFTSITSQASQYLIDKFHQV